MNLITALRAGSLAAGISLVGIAANASALGAVPPPEPIGSVDFPYGDFYAVPRLGTEEVLGTGCGGDGSIGETIPDGIWRGFVDSFDGPSVLESSSLEFNLICVYVGGTGERLRADALAADPANEQFGFPDGWMVDNNPRTRTVPLAIDFTLAGAILTSMNGCAVPAYPGYVGERDPDMWHIADSWLVIENGEAITAVTSCSFGGGEITVGCWNGGYAEGFGTGGRRPRCD